MRLSTAASLPVKGDKGDAFALKFFDLFAELRANIQRVESELERTVIDIIGSGILYQSYTPTLITATSGFNVSVGSHHLYRGFGWKITDTTILTIPPSGTYYLWEYQNTIDGAPDFAITTTNVNPEDGPDPDSNPPADLLAIPLATIVTDGSGVTSVTETFEIVYPFSFFTGVPGSNYIPVEENFPTWDSTNRSDGSINTCGPLAHAPISGTPFEIQRHNIVMVVGDTSQITIAGSPPTITFLNGFKPLASEIVFVRYFRAP